MDITTPLIGFNWTLLLIWVTVMVLFLILRKFFFEKVYLFMQSRENAVKDAFDSAEAVNRKADEKMQNYDKRIANLEQEGRDILKAAKTRADEQANKILEEAHEKAAGMIAAAEKQVAREQEKAVSQMKEQIAALAILAAEKIIENNIDMAGQERIVEDVIRQTGSSKWQS